MNRPQLQWHDVPSGQIANVPEGEVPGTIKCGNPDYLVSHAGRLQIGGDHWEAYGDRGRARAAAQRHYEDLDDPKAFFEAASAARHPDDRAWPDLGTGEGG